MENAKDFSCELEGDEEEGREKWRVKRRERNCGEGEEGI